MDPFSWIVIGTMIAGTLMQAYGQYQQGKVQQRWAEYNAAISKYEAAVEEQKARKERLALLSTQRARYAKAGVQLTGTPLEVMAETADELERDILVQKKARLMESSLYSYQGAAARQAGRWEAGTSLLTGAARAGATAYQFKKMG